MFDNRFTHSTCPRYAWGIFAVFHECLHHDPSALLLNHFECTGDGLNALKVERYRRDATCVTVLLLTIIGAIVGGRKVRGGSGMHLAVGFIIAALFIITDRFSTIFATKGNLPPLMAAWIPNFIFLFVILYLYKKAPK